MVAILEKGLVAVHIFGQGKSPRLRDFRMVGDLSPLRGRKDIRGSVRRTIAQALTFHGAPPPL